MTSRLPLLDVLEQKGNSDVNDQLSLYRERGLVDHTKTLAIPMSERIPALIKDPEVKLRIKAALSASILSAFNNIDKAKMSADQILDLTDAIIDSAHEDQLSIEDVLLFLKDLIMGKIGKITEKLDMPLFFELFEKYRDKRYKTLEAIRYEQHLNLKNMGHAPRNRNEVFLNRDEDGGSVLGLMQTMYENKKEANDGAGGND